MPETKPKPDILAWTDAPAATASVWVLWGESDAGLAWLTENCEDAMPWGGRGIACESRHLGDIVEGARGDGLTVARR